ncbi:MAG: response regulator [Deltaproteobacteria bacterium]|nr:response regulator [Deltaproteobacteria bacterium]
MNKMLVREILTLHGYEVVEAGSGKEALREIEKHAPDMVLMDLHLPEMDGLATMRAIKADTRFKALPVIALTASAMKGDEEYFLSQGFDGYLAKPVSVKALVDVVAGYLKKGR